MSPSVLVLGGARSGKSTWAEARLADRNDVIYVATSQRDPADAEWEERVALHRERRPSSWRTVETTDLTEVLNSAEGAPVLIDCLALWLTRVLDDTGAWDNAPEWRSQLSGRIDALLAALASATGEVVLVSNEVGQGVVPATSSGRLFRDELGRLNARVAAQVDEVWWCLAGIARRWK